ncbi:MAG: citrate lyase subunit alpha [Oscillospiraceae bacterium]|nr:citrate lyase subunit alpha [Oscillospiraceae bacterium]
MKNSVLREIPDEIKGYKKVVPYGTKIDEYEKASRKYKIKYDEKIVKSMDELMDKLPLKDGMTISFHHHLRNGDFIMNMVMEEIHKRGFKDITLAASAIFPVHSFIIPLIEDGTIINIYTDYMTGRVAEAVSRGKLKGLLVMQSHGGRPRAVESGEIKIDIAFIAAPSSDDKGNINGVLGKSSCGTIGYAFSDAEYAKCVVIITDNLVPYPNNPIEIDETRVDYVLTVDSIGDPKGIVSGSTVITRDPVGLKIAKLTMDFLKLTGYIKEGFSFQTGAGGTSLAVANELKNYIKKLNIKGSFASGGITGYLVDMLEEGLFKNLFDVQCFDLKAVESYRNNSNHQSMTASMYGNPHNKGCVVDNLDVVILGATEIDTNFNVNVITDSNGIIMGGSGGHCDTAQGAKLSVVVSTLTRARLPIIRDEIITITTPGETVDVFICERGIAINPLRQDLIDKVKDSNLPLYKIEELKDLAESITGVPDKIKLSDDIIGVVEYRDGTVIDVLRKVEF